MSAQLNYSRACDLVAAAKSISVIGHLRPDADAIGSITATVAAFRQLGKDAAGYIGQSEAMPENLYTIPGAREIYFGAELGSSDLVVVVDCGSIERAGLLEEEIRRHGDSVIVVDHHATNSGFGIVNLIDSAAESTTTILHDWFKHFPIQLNETIAHGLYAGLLTDTGCFRWGRPIMHDLARELMECGLDIREISADLIDKTTINELRLVGQIVSRIEMHQAGPFSLAVLIADYDTINGHSKSTVEGLIETVRAVDGADFGAVFKEYEPGLFTVSLRSAHLSVGSLAVHLGGGGHIPAAGYTARGSELEALDTLISAVIELGETLRSTSDTNAG